MSNDTMNMDESSYDSVILFHESDAALVNRISAKLRELDCSAWCDSWQGDIHQERLPFQFEKLTSRHTLVLCVGESGQLWMNPRAETAIKSLIDAGGRFAVIRLPGSSDELEIPKNFQGIRFFEFRSGIDAETIDELATFLISGTAEDSPQYFQLTHDFLVPALRTWMRAEQKKTYAGRAEIALEDRTDIWVARGEEAQQLPPFWSWLWIAALTKKQKWSSDETRLMKRAGRRHSIRVLLPVVIAAAFGLLAFQWHRETSRASDILAAHYDDVPSLLQKLPRWQPFASREFQRVSDSAADADQKLKAQLGLLQLGSFSLDKIETQLLTRPDKSLQAAEATQCIAKVIANHDVPREVTSSVTKRLFSEVDNPNTGLRAASSIATIDPTNPQWKDEEFQRHVSSQLTREPSWFDWDDSFRELKHELAKPLREIHQDMRLNDAQRIAAFGVLTEFFKTDHKALIELASDADLAEQLEIIIDSVSREEVNNAYAVGQMSSRAEANLAAVLLRFGDFEKGLKCFDLRLSDKTNRSARTRLIELLTRLEVPATRIWSSCVSESCRPAKRYGFLIALGDYARSDLNVDVESCRQALETFAMGDDIAVRSAAIWLMERWGISPSEELFEEVSIQEDRNWHRSKNGHDLAICRGPAEFMMGSPANEPGRDNGTPGLEKQHQRKIPRSFAISTKEVTVEQFCLFKEDAWNENRKRFSPLPDCPMSGVTWYEAVAYCNWLSREEALEPCYPDFDRNLDKTKIPSGFYTRPGYRLPTEAEWEYFCRAGSTTAFCFGDERKYLSKYGTFSREFDFMRPVGKRRPNDLGLFDIYGNANEWCHTLAVEYPNLPVSDDGMVIDDEKLPGDLNILKKSNRILRGGYFQNNWPLLRSASRMYNFIEGSSIAHVGFRIARTIPD